MSVGPTAKEDLWGQDKNKERRRNIVRLEVVVSFLQLLKSSERAFVLFLSFISFLLFICCFFQLLLSYCLFFSKQERTHLARTIASSASVFVFSFRFSDNVSHLGLFFSDVQFKISPFPFLYCSTLSLYTRNCFSFHNAVVMLNNAWFQILRRSAD